MHTPHHTPSPLELSQLVLAWKQALRELQDKNALAIAHEMVQALVNADHDEWWSDDVEEPAIARIAEFILVLEIPDTWLPDWSNPQHNAIAAGELKLGSKQLKHWIDQRRNEHWQKVINLVGQMEPTRAS